MAVRHSTPVNKIKLLNGFGYIMYCLGMNDKNALMNRGKLANKNLGSGHEDNKVTYEAL